MSQRLLVITSSYPRWPGDHAGAFVASFCRHLAARGAEVEVIAPSDGGHPLPGTTSFRYAPAAMERLFYGAGVPENLASHPALAALAAPALASMLARVMQRCLERRPDRLIAHWLLPCGLIARVAGALLDIPVRLIAHSGDVHLLSRLPAALTRWLARGARIAAVSQPLADALAARGAAPDPVLPMGFEPIESTPAPTRPDWLWMGRLVPIKAPQDALRAFHHMLAILPQDHPRPHLHIAGDGPLRAELADLIASLDLPATLYGVLTHAQLAPIMSRCRASIWSSTILADGRHEGAPVSLLECCAASVTPLIAQVPGSDWLLCEPQTQRLPERDLERWAAQMAALHTRADLADLGARTAQRVAPLAWPQLITRWASFID